MTFERRIWRLCLPLLALCLPLLAADETVVPKVMQPDADLPAREFNTKVDLGSMRYSPREEQRNAQEVLAFYARPGQLFLDADQQARLERIAHRLITAARLVGPRQVPTDGDAEAPLNFTFRILNNNDKNAFSAWGGNIFISRGLLEFLQSDDELAGVIGHEIAHTMFHHLHQDTKRATSYQLQQVAAMIAAAFMKINVAQAGLMAQYLYLALFNGHSVEHESQSDRAGCYYTYRAGYNPVGLVTAMERLHRYELTMPTPVELGIFQTHPWSNDRAHALEAQIRAMGLPVERRDVVDSVTAQVHAWQPAAGAPRVDLVLGDLPLFQVAPVPGQRAEQRAAALALGLNQALGQGTRAANLMLVPAGANFAIKGFVHLQVVELLTLTPADAALAGRPLEAHATAVWRRLKARLEKDELATGAVG